MSQQISFLNNIVTSLLWVLGLLLAGCESRSAYINGLGLLLFWGSSMRLSDVYRKQQKNVKG